MNKEQKIGIFAKKKQAAHLRDITRYYASKYAIGGENNDFCRGMCEAYKIIADVDDELEMQYWIDTVKTSTQASAKKQKSFNKGYEVNQK